jgi:hypothetical protein
VTQDDFTVSIESEATREPPVRGVLNWSLKEWEELWILKSFSQGGG